MLANPLILGLSLLGFLYPADALRVPLRRSHQHTKRSAIGSAVSRTNLGHGTSKSQILNAANDGDEESLATKNDLLYMANVTIGGNEYTLQLDTGSSDLWVATTDTIPNSQTSSLTYNLTYGIGYASGHIVTAPVSFANADVQSQAFLLATDANNPVSGYGAAGILGLGFTSLSSIDSAVNKSGASWGRSFLYNAFQNDTSTPNYITFSLQRDGDPKDDVSGVFTIGEYADGLEDIGKTPNISTWPENSPNRWNILLDGFYISGVQQSLSSGVIGAPSGKAVTLIDSGTSYTYADPVIVNAMYSSISGASLDNSTGMWEVPCDAEVDVTLVYAGNPYPVHPLDVVDKSLNDANKCTGTFVGQSLSVGSGEFDWLIGDNVLRSIYTLYDFGDFQPNGQMGNPYMKLYSLTNLTAASADFHSIRGGQPNTTITATGVSFNGTSNAAPPSGTSATDDLESNINKLVNYVPILLGILGFNSAVLLGLAICALMYFVRRRKGRGKNGESNRDSYHYTRVRSQYGPNDMPPPSPSVQVMQMGDMPPQDRPESSLSKKKHTGPDSPFTPPVEIKYEEVEGDMANQSLHPLNTNVEHPPNPHSAGSSGFGSAISPASGGDLPVPRPRFMSTTTMGSDGYGRPQSLFSVASGPLLSPQQSQMANRPASAYDMPMDGPRPRFPSTAMSDGRPDSTFSTSPLMPRGGGNSPGPSSPLSERMPRPSDVEGTEMMPPPRPRFMSDANSAPRPVSSFSMGAAPLRPQSKFIDASGERPHSQAI